MRIASFLGITIVGIILFPVITVLSVLAFWADDQLCSRILCIYAIVHLTFLIVGSVRNRLGRRLFVPMLLAVATTFGYNRRWLGQTDNSPFSNGIGTVDQHAYGVFAWFRKFDQPYSRFGDSYVDWTAVALNIELVICFLVLIAAALNCMDALNSTTAEQNEVRAYWK